MVAFPVTVSDF